MSARRVTQAREPVPTGQGDHVRIFDTSLRDGEQSPGCTMTREEKRQIARQLHRLGVDIIEAGLPAASRGDGEAVQAIGHGDRSPASSPRSASCSRVPARWRCASRGRWGTG